jgi:hypothetical protein
MSALHLLQTTHGAYTVYSIQFSLAITDDGAKKRK